jgi:hypothetical protein
MTDADVSFDARVAKENLRRRRERDYQRWLEHQPDECMLCDDEKSHAEGKFFSLFIDCFSDLTEIAPEFIDLTRCPAPMQGRGYYLRLCGKCHTDLLRHLKKWRKSCAPTVPGRPGSRHFGKAT